MFFGAIEDSNRTELGANECHTTLNIEGHSVKFKVNTGSQVNILPSLLYKQLNIQSQLAKSTTRLTELQWGKSQSTAISSISVSTPGRSP